jgi:hypothetical protein
MRSRQKVNGVRTPNVARQQPPFQPTPPTIVPLFRWFRKSQRASARPPIEARRPIDAATRPSGAIHVLIVTQPPFRKAFPDESEKPCSRGSFAFLLNCDINFCIVNLNARAPLRPVPGDKICAHLRQFVTNGEYVQRIFDMMKKLAHRGPDSNVVPLDDRFIGPPALTNLRMFYDVKAISPWASLAAS